MLENVKAPYRREGVNPLESAGFYEKSIVRGRDFSDFGTGKPQRHECARNDSAALSNDDV